ncbi:division/cell wall cluster transcriptional repressor MraZ [soil metagenome]|jgi:MraZ protein
MEANGEVSDAAVFLGEYQHTLDPKGRLILPSAFREALREGLVMTVAPDRCLAVHPAADWPRILASLRSLRFTDGHERSFSRAMTSTAHRETPDRQGRVTIPARLRDFANLVKDVTVVGADARLELWQTGAWEAYRDRAMDDLANTDQPFNLGIF